MIGVTTLNESVEKPLSRVSHGEGGDRLGLKYGLRILADLTGR